MIRFTGTTLCEHKDRVVQTMVYWERGLLCNELRCNHCGMSFQKEILTQFDDPPVSWVKELTNLTETPCDPTPRLS